MRSRTSVLVTLGVAAYALFLVALLPARLVTSRVMLPPGVTLESVDGSIWNGTARVSVGSGSTAVTLDRVHWHWRPLALLSGRIAYGVEASGTGLAAHGTLARGPSAWALTDVDLQGDVAALAALAPLAAPWQPAGRLHATASELTWDGRELRGRAQAQWSDAALALSSVRPLGTYALHLEGAGGPARITLATTQGALRISGDGTLDGLRHFALTGEARAEGPDAQALTPLLDLLGPRRPDGSRAIRLAA
ncbi:MAG TPA: type II secretion system protein N [Usitatibacter sp.]|jgi:general secretion pathway protein N|nr:type II secretion system protein N [Usitatibacter sp.]